MEAIQNKDEIISFSESSGDKFVEFSSHWIRTTNELLLNIYKEQ